MSEEIIVPLDQITTKVGDNGKSLKGGPSGCVFADKSDVWFDVVGGIDELNAIIGMSMLQAEIEKDLFLFVQNALFDIGSDLYNITMKITPKYTDKLAAGAEKIKAEQEALKSFMLPVGVCSYWHFARAATRRIERSFWLLYGSDNSFNIEIGRFLNRLSDLLFIVARQVQINTKSELMVWKPGELLKEVDKTD